MFIMRNKMTYFEVLMQNTSNFRYAIDNASILFLAQMRSDHTNSFRFSMTLTEEVSPNFLQQAVDRVYPRFPTIFAGFLPGYSQYYQIPSVKPPQVCPDSGCLASMSAQELKECAYRVFYSGKTVSIEAFHALTDGHGAIASFTTLIAEYLQLKYGIQIPVSHTLLDIDHSPLEAELRDSFLDYADMPPSHLPSRYAYQLPGAQETRSTVQTTKFTVPISKVLDAAHRYGVTVNTLITALVAASVMDVQTKSNTKKAKPVRIMVPVNLRKLFPSQTLRNFSYYVLPTMEPEDSCKPFSAQLDSLAAQMKSQLKKEHIGSLISYNVRTQNSWFFNITPLHLKFALMRLVCRFFGERTSSITVTNLGNITIPEEMRRYVTHMDVALTPRMLSPYGCSVLSYADTLTITLSRFPQESVLDEIFSGKLQDILREEHSV